MWAKRLKTASAARASDPKPVKGADLGTLDDLEGQNKRNRSKKPVKALRRKVDGSDGDYDLALAAIRAKHTYGTTMYNQIGRAHV